MGRTKEFNTIRKNNHQSGHIRLTDHLQPKVWGHKPQNYRIIRIKSSITPYKTYGLFVPQPEGLDSEVELQNSIRLERIIINQAIYDLRIIWSQMFGGMSHITTKFNTI